ncbi:hypothetical protein AcW1_002769 [Taiwanofungus camphoratus]|nr:hypothetical protein AcW1_002769 [Antrodia cinnamomea]
MSSRPPPKRGSSMVARVYRSSLRPVVVVVGLISAVWSLIWAIGNFKTISVDKDHGFPKLGTFAIVLGIIYIVTCAIEAFGVTAASLQNLGMIKFYALLSVVSSFAVVGAALMRVIIHFVLKNDLITECEQVVQGDVVVYEYGIWGPTFEDRLNATQAASYCKDAWKHDSFVEIISLIIELLISVFFSAIAFAYYNQMLDPTSAANVSRAPVTQPRDDAYPSHYNPPYLAYDAPEYAPPDGPPPSLYEPVKDLDYSSSKPPTYSEDDLGTYGQEKDDKSDPFADFDGPRLQKTQDRLADRDTLV